MRKRIWIPVVGIVFLLVCSSLGRMTRVNKPPETGFKKPTVEAPSPSNSGNLHSQIRKRLNQNLIGRAPRWDADLLEPEEWAKVFPYQPEYHPTLTYDPQKYHPTDPSTWHLDQALRSAVKRHGYLARFYDNTNRFSKEFQKMYLLLKDCNRESDPLVMGSLFYCLSTYHTAMQHDPGSLVTTPWYDDKGQKILKPIDGETTWGQHANQSSNSILAYLTGRRFWPEHGPMIDEEAISLTQTLISEIPPYGFLTIKQGQNFAYDQTKELALEPGDRLLVK